MYQEAHFSDLPAFCAAHYTDTENATGCTVFVAPEGAVGAVDVRGGAPATRETDLLRPENMVQNIHAVVLSGGSAFGLEAACGVMDELAARGIGFQLAGCAVPIVCGAALFDLAVQAPVWPDKAAGAAACASAFTCEGDLAQGNVGAGTGATLRKFALPEVPPLKGGFGWAGVREGGLVVLAAVAVNAAGNVVAQGVDESMCSADAVSTARDAHNPGTNTTLGCVLTNAQLSKAEATKVAQITHDAYARALKPCHTTADGDAIFVMASGPVQAPVDSVAVAATEAMERAIYSAVRHATSAYGIQACNIAGQSAASADTGVRPTEGGASHD